MGKWAGRQVFKAQKCVTLFKCINSIVDLMVVCCTWVLYLQCSLIFFILTFIYYFFHKNEIIYKNKRKTPEEGLISGTLPHAHM